jgi:uncharacterized protein (DUF427 family)
MKAIWNNEILADASETIVVDGNHYFPPASLHKQFFKKSEKQTVCSWKGTAYYYDIEVNGQSNKEAAWFYPEPKSAANNIAGFVAFWKGVQIIG